MSRVDFSVVIPARFASSRLPGKALADIAGKPMIVRVAERARESGAAKVCIATDHDGIREAVERHGFLAVMTRPDHPTGTDRIGAAARYLLHKIEHPPSYGGYGGYGADMPTARSIPWFPLVGVALAIYALHAASGGFSAPPERRRAPYTVAPRKPSRLPNRRR